jgi:KRAB domain-containing zinc finger protein
VPAAVFICEKCHKLFPSDDAVRQHLQLCVVSWKQPLALDAPPMSSRDIEDQPGDSGLKCSGGAWFIPDIAIDKSAKSTNTNRSGRTVDTTATNADKQQMHECQHCGLHVSNISLHLELHSSPVPGVLKCVYSGCQDSLFAHTAFKKHLLRHKLDVKHNCQVCGRIFSALPSLYSHRRQHAELRMFACKDPDCIFTGNVASELKMHESIAHHNVPVDQCKYCGRDFKKTLYLLKSHVVKHKTVTPGVFRCIYHNCAQMTFTALADLKSHVKNKHSIMKKVCNVCGSSFQYKSQLAKHKSKHAPCQFPDCIYIGNKNSDLQMHEHTAHSATAGLCHYCSSEFITFPKLQFHMAKHKSPKPGVYRCVHLSCALMSFTSVADVKKHVVDQHPIRQKLLLCDVCCCSFVSSETLAKHKMQHTLTKPSDHSDRIPIEIQPEISCPPVEIQPEISSPPMEI